MFYYKYSTQIARNPPTQASFDNASLRALRKGVTVPSTMLMSLLAAFWLLAATPALADTEHVWSLINRYGDSQHQGDWEIGLLGGQDAGLNPIPGTSSNFDWDSHRQGQQFTISYDPATGQLVYKTQGANLVTTLAAPDSVASYRLQIEAFARQMSGETSSVKITDLAVNGQPLGDQLIVATNGRQAQSLALENLPTSGFTITGRLQLDSNHLSQQSGGSHPPGNAHGWNKNHPSGSHPPGHAYGWGTGSIPTSLGSNLGAMFSLQAIKGPPGGAGGGAAAAPEPATLLLTGSALGAVALWRRRRKKRLTRG